MSVSLIAILGMHRSGTSCLAGSLEARGLHLGPVFEWSPHNPKGNRENADVMSLNEAVLEASGGSWDHPPAALTWTAAHVEERDRIIDRCTSGATTTWGFKDPRTVFTLPFWQNASKPMMLVGTFRHPLLAARSLATRNGMPLSNGLWLWKQYNARLLEHRDEHPFPLVSFDVVEAEYLAAVERVGDGLRLPQASGTSPAPFLEDRFRHQDLGDAEPLPPDVADLYGRLIDISQAWRGPQA